MDEPRHFDSIENAFRITLRRLRAEKGLSQEELAFRSGLSRTYIAYLETGRYQPSLDTFVKLAEGLSMSATALMEEVEKERGVR